MGRASEYYDAYLNGTAPQEEEQRPQRTGGRASQYFDAYMAGVEPTVQSQGDDVDASFMGSAVRGAGGIVRGIGSAMRDTPLDGLGLQVQGVGQGWIDRNPSVVNDPGTALRNPLQTVQEAVGEQVPQFAMGMAARSPIGLAAHAGINILSNYGNIRQEQRDQGIDDKLRAGGAAVVSGAMDTAMGTARIGRALGTGADILAREAGKRLLPHVAKQVGKGMLEEGVTEGIQTGIERFGGYQDLTGGEAMNDYAMSVIKGGVGGGAIRGGLSSVAGTQRSPIPDTRPPGGQQVPPEEEGLPPGLQQQQVPTEQEMQPPPSVEVPQIITQGMVEQQAQQQAADQQAVLDETRKYYRIEPDQNIEGQFNVLGTQVHGEQAATQLVTELAELRSILPPERQAIETALMDAGLVEISPKSPPRAQGIARALDKEIKNLQLQEARDPEHAAQILESQIDALVAKGKDEGDVRVGDLSRAYEALTKRRPKAFGGESVAPTTPAAKTPAATPAPAGTQPTPSPTSGAPVIPTEVPPEFDFKEGQEIGVPTQPQGVVDGGTGVAAPGVAGSVGVGSPDAQGGVAAAGPAPAVPGRGDGAAQGVVGAGAAVPAVPTGAGERPAPVVTTRQSRLGKKRVVVPTAPAAAYVAPPSEDVAGIDNRPPVDMTTEDQIEVARETGMAGVADAVEQEATGQAAEVQALPEDAEKQVFEKRFERGQKRVRDRDTQIVKAYIATMRNAPRGAKGKIRKALGEAFGLSDQAIRKIGNPRLLVDAARDLGYDERQVRDMLGITTRKTRQTDDVAAMERELTKLQEQHAKERDTEEKDLIGFQMADLAADIAQAKERQMNGRAANARGDAQALAEQGITAAEGDTLGFGDDANREWARTGTSIEEQTATMLADLQARVEAYRDIAAELDAAGMKQAAEAIAKARAALEEFARAEVERVAKEAQKPAKAKAEAKPKAEKKAEPPAEDLSLTTMERAEQNWNKAIRSLRIPELPLWSEVPSDFQDQFAEFEAKDQGEADVMDMVRKMNEAGVSFDDGDLDMSDETSDPVSYGKNDLANATYTAKELEAELKTFMRVDSLGRKVVIVDSVDDLKGVDLKIGKAVTDAFGWTRDGKAVLIANRMQRGTGRAKFMHEVGSHLGIDQLLPGDLHSDLAMQVADWAKKDDGSLESQIAQRAMARMENAKVTDEDAQAEAIAYFVEEAVLAGVNPSTKGTGPIQQWFQKVINALKQALTKLGFKPETLTAQDVVDIAFGAAKRELNAPVASGTKFGKNMPQAVKTVTRHLAASDRLDNVVNKVVFTDELFERATKAGMPTAKTMMKLSQDRAATMGNMMREVQRVEDLYKSIPQHERGDGPNSTNELLKDITMEAKWPEAFSWAPTNAIVDRAMSQRFKRMSASSQAFIEAVLKHGHQMLALKQQTVKDSLDQEYDAMIRQAVAAGSTRRAAQLQAAKRDQVEKFKKLLEQYDGHPYAPLRRFGDYVVVAQSTQYLNAKDKKDKAKLERDENHYQVSFFESMGEARAAEARLKASGKFDPKGVYARQKEAAREDMFGGMMDAFNKLRGEIDKKLGDSVDQKEFESLKRARHIVSELYLHSLSESSARKSELKRKGVAGEIDMLRSFTTQGAADAHFVAAARFNPKSQDAITQLRKEARTGQGDTLKKSMIFNEIIARYTDSMKFNESIPIVKWAMRTSSIWWLATSPTYFLQNMTQPFMLSVPFMAGKHAYGKAVSELGRAYTEMGGIFKGAKLTRQLNLTAVPQDVKQAIEELANRGRIDIGMETELGKVKLHGESAPERALQATLETLDSAVQRVEVINRISTAMAAYRMEKARTGSHQEAVEYADLVIRTTHGDYSSLNAPRAFNKDIFKPALQFRKFQLIQLSLLVNLVHDAVKADPVQKAMARRTLAFTLGHVAALTGAVGLPGFAAVSFALSVLGGIFGDDDEPPFDLERWMREKAGPGWLTDMLMRGAPTQAGVDASGKIGMGNAISVLPFVDLKLDDKTVKEAGFALLTGATGALTVNMAAGLAMMRDGEYYKGLEKTAPKGVRDLMKSIRESSDGVTRKNGDVLVKPEEISLLRSVGTALGIPLHVESKRRLATDAAFEARDHFKAREESLRREFMATQRAGKPVGKVVDEWRQLQKAKAQKGLKPTPVTSLYKAAKNQKERERLTTGGVQYRKGEQKFIQSLTQE